ncbi:MAG: rRNA pseudouridine synthase [Oscillospiraceae bacterium]|jgi:23S rRNA pseudouridine2605 synthase|nr:rRNA pseudouridine synthase [Oscillospiraceae bacterium]
MQMRLQKILSSALPLSRRAAETAIAAGRVTVNGAVAALGSSADAQTDVITLDGAAVDLPDGRAHTYIMLNKPKGVITSAGDDRGRTTVLDLVPDGRRLFPVGRLDMNSEGLLLLTDDGELTYRLTHPKFAVTKTYRVETSPESPGKSADFAERLRLPALLPDGAEVQAKDVRQVRDFVFDVTIGEGRNRQVRKMCAAAGLRVRRLTRIREGSLLLGSLPPGQWRELAENEIQILCKEVDLIK